MAQRPHVPQFGNWESGENVPYTVYFEKARKGKTGGKMINPNDPQENPDMFPGIAAQASPSRSRNVPEEPVGRAAVRPAAHEVRVSREDSDLRQFNGPPVRNGNMGPKGANESSAHQRHGGRGPSSGRPVRNSVGSEHSIERSPLHPHYQAKVMGKGSESSSFEGKNSYELSHGKSRLKPVTRGDESPDRGAAVPKFGDWDEKNPSAADGYTHIFNQVREERHTGPGQAQGTVNKPSTYGSYPPVQKRNANGNSKCGCFPWCGK
ncbi:RPM1-interacting protein 4-like [Cornus florida]|uniref:RPM1-interacting protein 4-like n=1 Tax=Cornus florida TaxID=4283 RepID=UPI00289BFCE1|nr:RPM1-interacting protein 4-like [Cornus florida]